MLKIGLHTGTMMLNTFEIEGKKTDDVFALVDEYVQEHKEDFATYDYDELFDPSNPSDSDDFIDTFYMPINGGEYYVGRIELIEEI